MTPDDLERVGIDNRLHILRSSKRTMQDPLLKLVVASPVPNVWKDELQTLGDAQRQKRHHNSTQSMLMRVSSSIKIFGRYLLIGRERKFIPKVYAQAVVASGSGRLWAVTG